MVCYVKYTLPGSKSGILKLQKNFFIEFYFLNVFILNLKEKEK